VAFGEAIKLDPNYAAGWAAIAGTYNAMGIAGWMLPSEAYPKVREAAEHALKIDPNDAVALGNLGAYEWNFMRDFSTARRYLERARALEPTLHQNVAANILFALIADRSEEAIELARHATTGDPLNADWWDYLDTALQFVGRLSEAEKAARNVLEINPGYSGAHCALGEVLLAEKKLEAALATMNDEADPTDRWCTADALWALGRRSEADAVLADAKRKYANFQAVNFAASYAIRSDTDEAFKWLERAYNDREPAVTVIGADPRFHNLRGDVRYKALLRKMKLPE
jgi:adenylate cyclase